MPQVEVNGEGARPPGLEEDGGTISPSTWHRPAHGDARFRALVEHASDVLLLLDAHGVIGYASPAVARVGGYRAEDMVGTSAFALAHPEDLPRLRALHARLLAAPGGPMPRRRTAPSILRRVIGGRGAVGVRSSMRHGRSPVLETSTSPAGGMCRALACAGTGLGCSCLPTSVRCTLALGGGARKGGRTDIRT